MGYWGTGNFDGDEPREYLAQLIGEWERDVELVLSGKLPGSAIAISLTPGFEAGLSCLLPTIEVMIAVAEKIECDYLPAPDTVEKWSKQFLHWYDEEIVSWKPTPAFKESRREVIEDTFARLLEVIQHRIEQRESNDE